MNVVFEPWLRSNGLSLEWIELAVAPVTSLLTNQPVASESERARDQCHVTPPVNLCLSFLSLVSRHFNDLNEFIDIDI